MSSSFLPFRQNSSLIRRLTAVVVLVALAFLLQAVGTYVSSRKFLSGLSEINATNRIYSLLTTTGGMMSTSSKTLEKATLRTNVEDLDRVFEESYQQASHMLDEARSLVLPTEETGKNLVKVRSSLDGFYHAAKEVLKPKEEHRSAAAIKQQTLVASQYYLEFTESYRKSLIGLQQQGTLSFEGVYRSRHLPLLVAILLSVISFSFVLLIGLSITRKITRSLENLLVATDTVASGDLTFEASIIESDELGKLTHSFNQMVRQLSRAHEQMARLQSVTAKFSEALSPAQIGEFFVREGLRALNADSGLLVLANTEEFEVLWQQGYATETFSGGVKFPLLSSGILKKVMSSGQAFWDETGTDSSPRPVQLPFDPQSEVASRVALPLVASGKALGAVVFTFAELRVFSSEEREFVLAFSRQCAQALARALLYVETQRLYKETQKAVLVRDEFLSIASHELRTPLTPLKLQVQSLALLSDRGTLATASPEKLKRMTESATAQIDRLTKLVDELLDVTRITSGRIELHLEEVDISSIVREVVERFTGELERAGCALRLELSPNLIGRIDPFRFEQVITNLLSNAIRYSPGKPIEVRSQSLVSGFAQIEVRDYGIGISADDQKRIFERFERAVPSANFGGLGLGLFIAKQIVQMHHGKISVESRPGEGATFRVRIPLGIERHVGAPTVS